MCDTSELDNTGKQVRPPMNKPDIPVTGGQLIDWAKEQQQLLYLDNARGERMQKRGGKDYEVFVDTDESEVKWW
ncbi:hypothetical protein AVEN_87898-1 [Araneus ventricosus]|uniref:Uncharacterized protein n=1 Tax=Araneus ventricosus TaxID=182803 RepID=A0A4Y2BBK0_ARAVE|nr:hypothetical protein AVEN_87898-1 [Araneus ventricosus]